MSIPIITGSPGVYGREENISQQDIPVSTAIAAITFGSRKGSLKPKLITSVTNFRAQYGKSDLSWSFGNICAESYFTNAGANLSQPPALWAKRVVNSDAKFAGLSIFNIGSGVLGDTANEIAAVVNPFPKGTANGYDSGGQQVFAIQFSQALATGASFGGAITYGNNVSSTIATTIYATSATATITAILAAINAALAAIPPVNNNSTGTAFFLRNDSSTRTILIYGPEGNPITLSPTFTGQAGNVMTSAAVTKLFDVFAENPGAWANSLGVNITNIDTGIFQRTQLNFSGPLIAANQVALTFGVNGNAVIVPPTTYATSSDATLTAIATAIQTAIPNSVVTAVIPAGSVGTSARQINIVAPSAGPGVITLISSAITAGTSQGVITFLETFAGVASKKTFALNIWQLGNLVFPIASYTCSLVPQLDGFSRQMFIEERVNKAAGLSNDIRIKANAAGIALGAGLDPTYASTFSTIVWLAGGNDGSLPTNSQILTGWDVFADTENYRVNILINGGYTDTSVAQHINLIASNRTDCIAIIDQPSDFQDVQGALNYRRTLQNIDSTYTAIYSPDVQILDTTTDTLVYIPMSGYAASRYVYTDNKEGVYWAPAGTDRGQLPGVVGVRQIYSKADRDLLDAAQINCIRQSRNGSGYVIWGDKTSAVTPSLLSAINCRRVVLYIESTIQAGLESNVFDNPSPQLLFLIKRRVEKFLQVLTNEGALKKSLVLIGDQNNGPYFQDAGQANISVYVTPSRAMRTILVDTIVTPSTITFNELEISGVF